MSNLEVEQIAGSKLVEIRYDLADADSDDLLVELEISSDEGRTWNVPTASASGHIGNSVSTGVDRRIIWDAGLDWDGRYTRTMKFRLAATDEGVTTPSGFSYIPAGNFEMGDFWGDGSSSERPVHTVYLDAFFIEKTETSNSQVASFLNWARSNNMVSVSSSLVRNTVGNQQVLLSLGAEESQIRFSGGSFSVISGKSSYPCILLTWYGAAALTNFRSQQAGLEPCYNLSTWDCDFSKNGYRLATEAEWEKAARGPYRGRRFPWGNSTSHSRANYNAFQDFHYDRSTGGYHPDYEQEGSPTTWTFPLTAPVRTFARNGYGLYQVSGNVDEWCHDRVSHSYYANSPASNPRGPASGSSRMTRGGNYYNFTNYTRVAFRLARSPTIIHRTIGMRMARNAE